MKRMKTILILLAFFTMVQAPVLPTDDVKKRTDALLLEMLREKQEREYNQEFQRYADYLGFKESTNNPLAINTQGCFGEHQWQQATLQYLGYKVTLKAFRRDSTVFPRKMQLEALKSLTTVNTILLKPYEEFIGKEIKGVIITKSGLLAACHLGGITTVRMYLLSNGAIDKHDVYGTRISQYIKEFSGFSI